MLRLDDVALRRGPNLLLSGATLHAHAGQRVGVVGINGSGKSSLFALLLGQLEADGGDIRMPPGTVIAHVAQSAPAGAGSALGFVMDGDGELRTIQAAIARADAEDDAGALPALHEHMTRIDGYAAEARAGRLLDGLGFAAADARRPVDAFSGGWRVRLALGRALMCRSDLLLLDEPTNHLDLPAILWLERWLQSYPGIALVISHDRDFMDAVCSHIAHIERQSLVVYSGNYSQFERLRAARLAEQQALHERQQKEVAHIRSFVDRFRAKATKARQAQSRLKMLERMELIAPAHVDTPFSFAFLPPRKQPMHLLQMDDAVAGYGDSVIVDGIRLNIAAGDRLGLLGVNGAGKSTLVKALASGETLVRGDRTLHRDTRIGYFAQHQLELLDLKASAHQHVLRQSPELSDQQIRDFLGGFGFQGERVFEPVAPFSGGEKARLVLALIVQSRPNLLLLDEPTNHLDLEMRHALTLALQVFEGALVVISHDRYLLKSVCDELYLVHGGRVERYADDLDAYARWVTRAGQADAGGGERDGNPAGGGERNRKAVRQMEARRRAELKPLRDAVSQVETELGKARESLERLTAVLADEAIYTDPSRKRELTDLVRQRGETQTRIEQLEWQWLEASERLEQAREETC